MKKYLLLHLITGSLLVAIISAFAVNTPTEVFLPGTQPGVVLSHESVTNCQQCHQTGPTGHPVTIAADWKGSPMAHSARDPIFYAAMAVANKYVAGSGEYCIRCHSPTGWLEGRSDPPTGQGLTGNDLNGVQCDFCHRMKDPMIPDSTINPPVPGYGNGMFVSQVARTPKRGPYSDAISMFHPVQADSFYRSSNFCGVCHNVSNPLQAVNATTQSPHEYGTIERTYSEWLLSWYATQGEAGTCQSCHMPAVTGYGANPLVSPLRTDLPKHDLTGGNTFLHDILADFWPAGLDTNALAQGKQRAMATLQGAATLDVSAYRIADTVHASVRITNLTGHKLPTGYPEGRRMWLSIMGRNASGDTVFTSGAYDFDSAELTHDPQVKIYETKPGLTAATAALHGLNPGPSFYFILNDSVYKDNRIPPRGFTNAAFAQHLAAPVAYTYADGQYWDETSYELPSAVTEVTATLYYQSASKEYITFLRDENTGNPNDWRAWGDSLYSAWSRRGKSRPVAMNSITVQVADSSTGVEPGSSVPAGITLLQNYPNPFNPQTEIVYRVGSREFVELAVYDLLGKKVATLVYGVQDAGEHAVSFDGSGLASGVYIYRLRAGSFVQTRKLVLLK